MNLTRERLEGIATAIGLLAFAAAMLALWGWGGWLAAASTLDWLKTGVWAHPSISTVLEPLGIRFGQSNWFVIQAVWSWCLNLPASLVLIALGVWIGTILREAEAEMSAGDRARPS